MRTVIHLHQPGENIIYYDDSKRHLGIIAQDGCYPSAFDDDVFRQSSAQVQVKPQTKSLVVRQKANNRNSF